MKAREMFSSLCYVYVAKQKALPGLVVKHLFSANGNENLHKMSRSDNTKVGKN